MSELDKLESVQEKSQAIGEFLDWMFSKGLCFARNLTEEEYESDENVEDVESAALGEFYKIHRIKRDELILEHIDIEKTLAEFFEIDLAKAEEERRELLAAFVEQMDEQNKDAGEK